MRTGRPMPPLTLTADERETLERWTRRPKTAQAVALRARLVLRCAEGRPNGAVAAALRMTPQTVGKWRHRFLAQRLDGLLDEPRPGTPRRIADTAVERVLTRTLESTPRDATHWSTRSLARACGLSQSTVSRIWRAFALQPHRTETFKLSRDPLFIEKVRDVVGLYRPTLSPADPVYRPPITTAPTGIAIEDRGTRALIGTVSVKPSAGIADDVSYERSGK